MGATGFASVFLISAKGFHRLTENNWRVPLFDHFHSRLDFVNWRYRQQVKRVHEPGHFHELKALPAELKTWNIPVLLASGLVVFLSAAQVKRMLRDKRSKDETEESDLILVKRHVILPDSQFGWI